MKIQTLKKNQEEQEILKDNKPMFTKNQKNKKQVSSSIKPKKD